MAGSRRGCVAPAASGPALCSAAVSWPRNVGAVWTERPNGSEPAAQGGHSLEKPARERHTTGNRRSGAAHALTCAVRRGSGRVWRSGGVDSGGLEVPETHAAKMLQHHRISPHGFGSSFRTGRRRRRITRGRSLRRCLPTWCRTRWRRPRAAAADGRLGGVPLRQGPMMRPAHDGLDEPTLGITPRHHAGACHCTGSATTRGSAGPAAGRAAPRVGNGHRSSSSKLRR